MTSQRRESLLDSGQTLAADDPVVGGATMIIGVAEGAAVMGTPVSVGAQVHLDAAAGGSVTPLAGDAVVFPPKTTDGAIDTGADGAMLTKWVGSGVGRLVGPAEGTVVGVATGAAEIGAREGSAVGSMVGWDVGT